MVAAWAEEAGFYLYDQRIWHKDPSWTNSRWHSNSYRAVDEFEHIYVFWKPGITEYDRERLSNQEWTDWGSRGVWNIKSVRRNNRHESEFPEELARRVIQLFSPLGGMVLDPFVGTGTTAVVADRLGRGFYWDRHRPAKCFNGPGATQRRLTRPNCPRQSLNPRSQDIQAESLPCTTTGTPSATAHLTQNYTPDPSRRFHSIADHPISNTRAHRKSEHTRRRRWRVRRRKSEPEKKNRISHSEDEKHGTNDRRATSGAFSELGPT